MINSAQGDLYMIGSFLSFVCFHSRGTIGVTFSPLALVIVRMRWVVLTANYGLTVERLAYRPLRGSFRLAPLISALGMSIFLQNYVQILQGARVKPLQPVVTGGFVVAESEIGRASCRERVCQYV